MRTVVLALTIALSLLIGAAPAAADDELVAGAETLLLDPIGVTWEDE